MPFQKGQSGNPRGRAPGTPNKLTGELKDMILSALDLAGDDLAGEGQKKEGAVAYLRQQAKENPGPFLALVGKILPLKVAGKDGGDLVVRWLQ